MNHKGNYRVLVVEDEALIRQNIIKKISAANSKFTIIGEAKDGDEALHTIEEHPPHLVVTDIRMPVMDGLELLKNLYFAYPNIKVIIISGYNDFEYARSGLQYGAKDFLLKPVKLEELEESLSRILIELNVEFEEEIKKSHSNDKELTPAQVADFVKKYIQSHYHETLTVADLADKLSYSSDYIGKVFKKYNGETLIKYMTRLRIQEAKRLLLDHPDMDVQDISTLIGYSDPFYFSRVFKKYTGQYPSEFKV